MSTQEASRQFAEAVFNDPSLRARFETMANETASRPAVPDDFAWLSSRADGFDRFTELAGHLFRVPKDEGDEVHRRHEE